jgi:hypothetical protein
VTWTSSEPVDARTAQLFASGHIRFRPMEVLCGACGGIGCGYCQEPEPEPRRPFWKRLLRRR